MFPPRPSGKMRPSELSSMESTGKYLVQRKFNGHRAVTAIENGVAYIGNRHGNWHSPSKLRDLRRELLRLKLPTTGTHYLDGELLNSGVLVLFDVLQINKLLMGVPQTARLDVLREVCGNPKEPCKIYSGGVSLALQVSERIWLAEHWKSDFVQHFHECIDHDLIEGLVLREIESTIDSYGTEEYEVGWQIRCRKPSKKYRH